MYEHLSDNTFEAFVAHLRARGFNTMGMKKFRKDGVAYFDMKCEPYHCMNVHFDRWAYEIAQDQWPTLLEDLESARRKRSVGPVTVLSSPHHHSLELCIPTPGVGPVYRTISYRGEPRFSTKERYKHQLRVNQSYIQLYDNAAEAEEKPFYPDEGPEAFKVPVGVMKDEEETRILTPIPACAFEIPRAPSKAWFEFRRDVLRNKELNLMPASLVRVRTTDDCRYVWAVASSNYEPLPTKTEQIQRLWENRHNPAMFSRIEGAVVVELPAEASVGYDDASGEDLCAAADAPSIDRGPW